MSEQFKEIENMAEFFNIRFNGYDEHMMKNIDAYDVIYTQIAEAIEKTDEEIQIVDYGCGTGLELKAIFEKANKAKITGIDLSKNMLSKLREKYEEERSQIELVIGSYLDIAFESNRFDYAVSVMTMHHFEHDTKRKLYRNILDSLKSGGIYIEGDYMVETIEDENKYLEWYKEIRKQNNIQDGLYHLDIPFTPCTQIQLLKDAGFKSAEIFWKGTNAAIIVARK